jgi:sialate O-acetylesterase
MSVLRGDRKAGLPPIALRSATIDGSQVKVVFDNVMGRLRADGKPSGFTLVGPQPLNTIYRVDLEGNTALLNTGLSHDTLLSASLYYGHGLAPHCNITDAADRSLPVFGPVPLGRPVGVSEFVRQFQVSRAMPSAGKLADLGYPKKMQALGFTPRLFPIDFADLHEDLFRCAPEDRLVYYLARIDCPQRMSLDVSVGYDGPVKVWLDGKPRYHDPNGVNPATRDKAMIPFQASASRHEVLIALGSSNGRAWGVFLRFWRRLTPRQAAKPVVLPKLMV